MVAPKKNWFTSESSKKALAKRWDNATPEDRKKNGMRLREGYLRALTERAYAFCREAGIENPTPEQLAMAGKALMNAEGAERRMRAVLSLLAKPQAPIPPFHAPPAVRPDETLDEYVERRADWFDSMQAATDEDLARLNEAIASGEVVEA
jgi:hypothetical protein